MVSFGAIDDRPGGSGAANSPAAMSIKPVTPVAVIGMACRLPGGIDSPEQLWEALLRGDDLVTEVPPDRWDADEYYDPEPGVPGRSVSKWGAFLDDVAGFDPEFFGINEREADRDRSAAPLAAGNLLGGHGARRSRLRESMADSLTGVFIGLTHDDYQLLARRVPAPWRGRTASPATLSAWRPGGSPTPWDSTVPR